MTYPEIAALLARARGRPTETRESTPADLRRTLLDRGLAEWEAGHLEEMYQLIRDDRSAAVTDDVERVTGQPAHTIEDYLLGGVHRDTRQPTA